MKRLRIHSVLLLCLVALLFSSCKILGKDIEPGLIVALVTAIYEIVIRLLPTSSKWLSLIEICYRFLVWLIPNRSTRGGNHN